MLSLFTHFHGSKQNQTGKKKKKKKKNLVDNIKSLVGSAIQRKWPEKRPGPLRQRNKIKGWT